MAVITISRQMGSLGCEVANIVANRLGYRLVWRDLINQAAHLAGMPEMALAAIDELGLMGYSPTPQMCQSYRQAVKQVVLDLANKGDVIIIGRAGQAILSNRTDCLHVRLIASSAIRAERVAKRQNVALDCAYAQIQASDKYRARYLQRCYGIRWDNPELYHLVINTGLSSPEQAALLICQAATAWFADVPNQILLSERNGIARHETNT